MQPTTLPAREAGREYTADWIIDDLRTKMEVSLNNLTIIINVESF